MEVFILARPVDGPFEIEAILGECQGGTIAVIAAQVGFSGDEIGISLVLGDHQVEQPYRRIDATTLVGEGDMLGMRTPAKDVVKGQGAG